jgi:hypothetical protein
MAASLVKRVALCALLVAVATPVVAVLAYLEFSWFWLANRGY